MFCCHLLTFSKLILSKLKKKVNQEQYQSAKPSEGYTSFVDPFVICVCVCHIVFSVPCSLVATCWERADLLALYVMF